MSYTVIGVFHTPAEAEQAVADLLDKSIPRSNISVIAPGEHVEHIKLPGSNVEHAEDMAIGAVGGGLVGGLLGALVGMVVVAIPGIGPVLAVGPLAAAIGSTGVSMAVGAGAGAVGGGVLGALTWAGITPHEAQVYEEFVRRGGTLVVVQATRKNRELVTEILHRDGAASASELEEEWRREGLL